MQQPPTPCPTEPLQVVYLIVSVISAAGVLAAAVAAWASTRITRQVFESAYRPYVGVEAVGSITDLSAGTVVMTPVIKNYGSVPAQILSVEWRFRLNGEELSQSHTEKNLHTVFPQRELKPPATLSDARAAKASTEGGKLALLLTIKYRGPGKKVYRHEQEASIQPGSAAMRLGGMTETEV